MNVASSSWSRLSGNPELGVVLGLVLVWVCWWSWVRPRLPARLVPPQGMCFCLLGFNASLYTGASKLVLASWLAALGIWSGVWVLEARVNRQARQVLRDVCAAERAARKAYFAGERGPELWQEACRIRQELETLLEDT